MLEQLALAHFRVGHLHLGAAQAEHVEAVKAYSSAAAAAGAEFRRTALALCTYRGALSPGGRGRRQAQDRPHRLAGRRRGGRGGAPWPARK